MKHFKYFCQFNNFILFILFFILSITGCSILDFQSDAKDNAPVKSIAQWFDSHDPNFVQNDWDGQTQVHPFFDLAPFPEYTQGDINFYPLSLPGDGAFFQINAISGSRYLSKPFCAYTDVWGNYSKEINKRIYTRGIIPRMIDSLGNMQDVAVFGNTNYYKNYQYQTIQSERVSVIGATILKQCLHHPCRSDSDWNASLLLIAVDRRDSTFAGVKSLDDLKKEVDWPAVMADFGNSTGHNYLGSVRSGATRVTEVNEKKSGILRLATEKGKLYSFEELEKIKNGCLTFYNELYSKQSVLRKQIIERENYKKDLENYQNLKSIQIQKGIVDNVQFEKKDFEPSPLNNLSLFMAQFMNKESQSFYLCSKYVKYSNISEDYKRHWFFTYIDAFIKLNNMGYRFSCERSIWEKIDIVMENTVYKDHNYLAKCSEQSIDTAIRTSINMLSYQDSYSEPFYEYLEFDQQKMGTHQRLYSWIYRDGKELGCEEFKKNILGGRLKSDRLFPTEAIWEEIAPVLGSASSLIIQ